jgi:putative chitinase
MLTLEQLVRIYPYGRNRAARYLDGLNATMDEARINTPERRASFLAQVGVESGQLRYVLELASGEAYDTGRLAEKLGNTTDKDGDGQRYKGRGLLQITGRDNFRACSQFLFGDDRLLHNPELLETPLNACRSAGWYWISRGINAIADTGDQARVTRAVNGGTNGLQERIDLYAAALRVLKG